MAMRPLYRKWFRRILILLILIVAIAWFAGRYRPAGKAQANATPSVPVVAAPVQRGDLPIYLNGLGSVEAYYTVTVHSRVDGELMRFNVREGQLVQAGD